VPPAHLLADRVDSVLAVIYLIFNEGYAATVGDALIRQDLCAESIRLGRVLTTLLANEWLLPEFPEAHGLLALMLLHDSRRRARVDTRGQLVLLEEQDRSLWDRDSIEEGKTILEKALGMVRPGPYQIQAAISSLHAQADRPEDTDWLQIAALYDRLFEMNPSLVIALNRAVAVAMAEGPAHGLRLLDRLQTQGALSNYTPFHMARAELLRRAGSLDKARAAYERALELSQNEAERVLCRRRLSEIDDDVNGKQ
jgi:RNA polymerase sigma-70 factor (ECF subfamily)